MKKRKAQATEETSRMRRDRKGKSMLGVAVVGQLLSCCLPYNLPFCLLFCEENSNSKVKCTWHYIYRIMYNVLVLSSLSFPFLSLCLVFKTFSRFCRLCPVISVKYGISSCVTNILMLTVFLPV